MPHLTEMQKQSNDLTLTALAIGKCISDIHSLDKDAVVDILLQRVYIKKLQLLYEKLVDNVESLVEASLEYLEEDEDEES